MVVEQLPEGKVEIMAKIEKEEGNDLVVLELESTNVEDEEEEIEKKNGTELEFKEEKNGTDEMEMEEAVTKKTTTINGGYHFQLPPGFELVEVDDEEEEEEEEISSSTMKMEISTEMVPKTKEGKEGGKKQPAEKEANLHNFDGVSTF